MNALYHLKSYQVFLLSYMLASNRGFGRVWSHEAARAGQEGVVQLLLEARADANLPDSAWALVKGLIVT